MARTSEAIEIALYNLRQVRGSGNVTQNDRIDGAIEALKWVGDVEPNQLSEIVLRQSIVKEGPLA